MCSAIEDAAHRFAPVGGTHVEIVALRIVGFERASSGFAIAVVLRALDAVVAVGVVKALDATPARVIAEGIAAR